jgi:glycosyltransferase involved in cell wall biosynthesis
VMTSLVKMASNQADFILVTLFNKISPIPGVETYYAGPPTGSSSLPSSPLAWIRLSVRLGVSVRSVVVAKKPDVVLLSAVGPVVGVLLLSPSIAKKSVLRVTMNPFEVLRNNFSIKDRLVYLIEAFTAVVLSYKGHTVFPGAYLKRKFVEVFRIPLPHAVIIRNFVDTDRITRLSQSPLANWPDSPVVISVGRLVRQKNYPMLLQAFAQVLLIRRCSLLIVGEGELRSELTGIATSLGISKSVTFLGWTDNPYQYIARSSVFVQTSNSEGMPNSLIEAMTLGTPIISTATEGAIEVLGREDPAGILVPKNDFHSLTKAIMQVLENGELRSSLVQKSRKRSREFSAETSTLEFLKLFRETIQSS